MRNMRKCHKKAGGAYEQWLLRLSGAFMVIGLVLFAVSFGGLARALPYGAGLYGACEYSTCAVSVTSSGAVNLAMTKTTAQPTICSVQSDTVTVSTHSSTGYTLTISTPSTATETALRGTAYGSAINAVAHTPTTPSAHAANTWGYRVDGGAFGAGPTTPVSGSGIPTHTFAGVTASTTPSFLFSSSSPADAVATSVWFGVCASTTLPADNYTNSVVYSVTVS